MFLNGAEFLKASKLWLEILAELERERIVAYPITVSIFEEANPERLLLEIAKPRLGAKLEFSPRCPRDLPSVSLPLIGNHRIFSRRSSLSPNVYMVAM